MKVANIELKPVTVCRQIVYQGLVAGGFDIIKKNKWRAHADSFVVGLTILQPHIFKATRREGCLFSTRPP